MSTEQDPKNLSRRDFIKNTGVGIAAIGGGGILAGCSPQQANSATPTGEPATQSAVTSDVMNAELAGKKWSFEIAPDPIPESDIANTVEAEIIIVGAGVSGLVTANAAVENGAEVVLIAASSSPVFRGGSFHSHTSRYMQEAGFDSYDVTPFYKREMSNASYNIDQDKWYKFYNNSEEAMNWLIDKMEDAGYETVLEHGNVDPGFGAMHVPPGSHSWLSEDMRMAGMAAEFVVTLLAEKAQEGGATIIYNTIAKQLIREDDNTGRVTAVVALGEDGTYTKYVGTKAIVLATGDFSTDKEMMTKYCPWAMPLLSDVGDQGYNNKFKFGGLFGGDGQKMGLWVGAAWQRTFPNAPMIQGKWLCSNQPYGSHRGLTVNLKGYRYGSEDYNGPQGGVNQMRQPEMRSFSIWGSEYAEGGAPWYSFGMVEGADPIPPEAIRDMWEAQVEAGTLVKGDTIEEVIEKLGLPAETTLATVERYNELSEKGVDEDYYKRPELLVTIKEAPFYGGEAGLPDFLTVMGGLRTNINMQVCDENDEPIPGLYNVGTMVGDYYANIYNFLVAGNNLGASCLTFGYMTGKGIAEGTLT